MEEKKTGDARRETLLCKDKNGWDRISPEDRAAVMPYAEGYKAFMDAAKTEREAVIETIRMARAAGFVPLERGKALKAGDKVYRINRGKALMLAVIGNQPLEAGTRITAAHIDNPRLDLKPNPLYEDADMAFFKTHYYGGIKKYQWPTIPLAIHGVVCLKDGSTVEIRIGEKDDEPMLVITDLLIHLAGDQMKKPLAEAIPGESLNVLLGSIPLENDEGADRVKLAIMILLNEKYGITEEDFRSAELCMVPAWKARDAGLDRSMIGAFGHDDRVCAYSALTPILEEDTPEYTSVCVLADKEEIGSVGVSGMMSTFFETFMDDLCEAQGGKLKICLENSLCLSADVTAAMDPNFPEVSERRNEAKLNGGTAICKYTGSRGKSGASDASAELMARVRSILDGDGVIWQTTELGKVDQGGGGTVAGYMANRNIDTVDIGVPVLCMHAPMELVSKLDLYMTMRAMRAFYLA